MIDERTANTPYALIFDIGNVLIKWDPRYLYRQFFQNDKTGMENFLAEIDFTGWNMRQDAGRPFATGVADLCSQFPQYCSLIKAYHERWEESIGGAIWPTVAVVKHLKQAGNHLYGLSNFSAEKFPLMQQRYQFFDWFNHIILSGDVGIAKPDQRIFYMMSQRIQRPPQECLLIDDSLPNVQAARQVGFQAIYFRHAEQLKQDLSNYGFN